MTRVVALAWLAGAWMVAAAAGGDSDSVIEMRISGYFPGDLITQRVHVTLPSGARLVRAGLPAPGRVTGWLELREVHDDCERGGETCLLRLQYQVFGVPDVPTPLELPPFDITLRDARGKQRITVPAAGFVLAPMLPASADATRPLPLPAPRGLSRRLPAVGFTISLLGLVLSVVWCLWLDDRLPGLPRRPGPFTRLARARRADPGSAEDLLRDCLRAMNEAAGETLYAINFARLFERAPRLLPLRGELEALAVEAWATLYGAHAAPALTDVVEVVRAAAELERRG